MRKSLTKQMREAVKMKFGGQCAYCGTVLTDKFQVDHMKAVQRGGTNDFENLMPSCAPCNNFKLVFNLEQFRRELESQIERARKYSVNFRNAERFGLLQVTGSKVTFHFEKDQPRSDEHAAKRDEGEE